MEYGQWHLSVWYQRQERRHVARSHLIEYFPRKTIADNRHSQYIDDYLITQNIELTVAWIRHKSDHVEWLSTRFHVIVWLVCISIRLKMYSRSIANRSDASIFAHPYHYPLWTQQQIWMEEKYNKSSTHRTVARVLCSVENNAFAMHVYIFSTMRLTNECFVKAYVNIE